jgi:hypothetical protein
MAIETFTLFGGIGQLCRATLDPHGRSDTSFEGPLLFASKKIYRYAAHVISLMY